MFRLKKTFNILSLFMLAIAYITLNEGVATSAFAAPAVSGVSGTVSHGLNITVVGSSFGTKNPSAPLWWDDGEGALVNNKSIMKSGEMTWVVSTLTGNNKHYNDVAPTMVTQDSGNSNMQYRNVPHRSMSAPHLRSTKYLVGCHDDQGECLGGEVGQNVALNVSDHSLHNTWFITYYLRLDSAWPAYVPQNNYKSTNWEDDPPYGIYQTTPFCYDVAQGCGGGDMAPQCNQDYVSLNGSQLLSQQTCSLGTVLTSNTNVTNEYKAWTHVQQELNSVSGSQLYRIKHDNATMLDSTLDSDCTFTQGPFGGVTLGGFWKLRNCPVGGQDDLDDNACRYFDDIYVDNTFSRVVLTNNANYAASTIIEPQIPSAWSDGSITAKVNLGKLPANGRAYLFVFDSSNNHNTVGFCVPIGTGSCTSGVTPGVPGQAR